MPKVTFKQLDGSARTVEVKPGLSVMEAAIQHNVPGIEAECGGSCSCATCHVYVSESDLSKLTPVDELEDEMLDCTVAERQPGSRLSCQLTLTNEISDLTVTVPEAQV
jgi:2Fe-2S ferredoxin